MHESTQWILRVSAIHVYNLVIRNRALRGLIFLVIKQFVHDYHLKSPPMWQKIHNFELSKKQSTYGKSIQDKKG